RGPLRDATYLYPSEFLSLVTCPAVDRRTRRIYALAVYLYARAGELAALTCADIDLERGIVRIHRSLGRDGVEDTTKTDRNRAWIVEPHALPLLRVLCAEVRGRGRILPDWSRESYALQLRRHLRAAGLTRPE